jgi:hypothetical protein
MEMCAKVSEAAPQVQAFIDILTASSEFQVFVVSSQHYCPQSCPFSLLATGTPSGMA